jgi:ParB family transcriptional regulator, chromosome partitioning protein
MAKNAPKAAQKSGSLSLAAGLLRGLKNEEASIAAKQPVDHEGTAAESKPTLSAAPVVVSLPIAHSGGRLRIPIGECISNPYNPREFYPETKIHELALTLKRDGQIEAIKVTRLDKYPGKYVIIDGERRVRAARYLGDEFIDAELRDDQAAQDLYSIAYRANNDHERQTIFDDAIAWKRVLDAAVFDDQNALAQAVGKDKAYVSKTISLNTLPRAMLERMAESSDRVGLQAAYFIKLINDKAGEELADRTLSAVIDGKRTVRDLEKIVRELSDGATRQKKTRAKYEFRHDFVASGKPVGQLKAFPDGRLDIRLSGIPADRQESLADQLRRVIEEYTHSLSADGASELVN